MKEYLLVALGGALGSMLRYTISALALMLNATSLAATFVANVCGAFLIGLIMSTVTNSSLVLFGTVGVCGGFTTFSTFSVQTLQLFQSGQYGLALGYALASVVSCMIFVYLGMSLGRFIR